LKSELSEANYLTKSKPGEIRNPRFKKEKALFNTNLKLSMIDFFSFWAYVVNEMYWIVKTENNTAIKQIILTGSLSKMHGHMFLPG
jgi:hypothetical protein